jgi:hypothetical protein
LQICCVLPLHFVVPGVQTPAHALPLQMKGQGALVYWPIALHVWSAFATHFELPGTQTPVQAPFKHTLVVQAAPSCQAPFTHVSGMFPEHCVPPGVHVPAHMPWSHTN